MRKMIEFNNSDKNICRSIKNRDALIYSELPRHMDAPPFSVADKPLKMKENEKSHFSIFVL